MSEIATETRTIPEIIKDLTKAMVLFPKDVELHEESLFGTGYHMRLRVNAADAGKIIGSRGDHINALKTLIIKMGAAQGTPVRLTLLEPTVGKKRKPQDFVNDPDVNVEPLAVLTGELLTTMGYGGLVGASPNVYKNVMTEVADGDVTATVLIRKTSEMDDSKEWGDVLASLKKVIIAAGRQRGRSVELDFVDV